MGAPELSSSVGGPVVAAFRMSGVVGGSLEFVFGACAGRVSHWLLGRFVVSQGCGVRWVWWGKSRPKRYRGFGGRSAVIGLHLCLHIRGDGRGTSGPPGDMRLAGYCQGLIAVPAIIFAFLSLVVREYENQCCARARDPQL
mmetsp:Transcript_31459/g.75355  ORF Transcript_31459/g.75355 Transcript_31459/m.75355 type:complete len:141 (-) Transcript_31459:56-478(-)